MFYSKSIYALNKKDRDAIVYEDADGSLIRLTRENFPSKKEFLRFKAWSDENYHDAECEYHVYSDNTLFLEGISEMAAAVASVEDSFVAEIEEQDRKAICCLLMSSIAECLTDLQRRRMWMFCVDGVSTHAIAKREGTSQQNISRSLLASKKKIRKYFEKQGVKNPFLPR